MGHCGPSVRTSTYRLRNIGVHSPCRAVNRDLGGLGRRDSEHHGCHSAAVFSALLRVVEQSRVSIILKQQGNSHEGQATSECLGRGQRLSVPVAEKVADLYSEWVAQTATPRKWHEKEGRGVAGLRVSGSSAPAPRDAE